MLSDKADSHFDLIVKNGKIEIPSIFMFKNQNLELYEFLTQCRKMKCSIHFKNEDLFYDANNPYSPDNTLINIYQLVITDKNILKNYLNYLQNIDNMTWDKASDI